MQPIPTVAVLSTNPALSSLLGATLRRTGKWNIREFRDPRDSAAYMRASITSILVCDYDLGTFSAADLAAKIRADASTISRNVQIIALSRSVDADMRAHCVRAGIDEVVVKPMSPLYLEERVAARMAGGARRHISALPGYVGPERRERIALRDQREVPFERRGDNVISLRAHRLNRQISGTLRPDA